MESEKDQHKRWLGLGMLAAGLLYLGGCDKETTVEKATREGIFLIGNAAEPKGLDPHIVSGVLENNIISSLFEGLVVEDPSKDGVALPGMAEKWYPTDKDKPDEWVFELRKDAKWSDGTPLTAEDFLFSFRRLLTPELASDYSFMLYYIRDAEAYNQSQRSFLLCRRDESFPKEWESLKGVDFGPDENADEKLYNRKGLDHLGVEELEKLQSNPELFQWPDSIPRAVRETLVSKNLDFAKSGRDLWELIDFGATAPDEHTLKVKLNAPLPFLPEITKHYTWFPVPRHTVLKHGRASERFTDWTKPENLVCNGPFLLKSWVYNDHIEVTRNPLYWDAANVRLNGIRFLPIANYYTESRMFFNGQLHVTYTVAPELIPLARESYPDNFRSEFYLGTYFIRSNVTRKPFDDPRVRLAFSMSLDQGAIIDNVLQGGQKKATGLVPPFEGYPDAGTVQFDPEKARQLLAEAGYPGGKGLRDIEFLTTDKEVSKAVGEALQAIWKEHLGVSVKIKQMEWTSYLTNMFDLNYDLAAGGWIGDYVDPLTFLDMWMKGGGNNRTGWYSYEFEAILKEASMATNAEERYALLSKAEKLFLSERPILPVYYYSTNYLIHEAVDNWHPLVLNHHPWKFVGFQSN
jgi:oligopeptide transport system substrate-binding protein